MIHDVSKDLSGEKTRGYIVIRDMLMLLFQPFHVEEGRAGMKRELCLRYWSANGDGNVTRLTELIR